MASGVCGIVAESVDVEVVASSHTPAALFLFSAVDSTASDAPFLSFLGAAIGETLFTSISLSTNRAFFAAKLCVSGSDCVFSPTTAGYGSGGVLFSVFPSSL